MGIFDKSEGRGLPSTYGAKKVKANSAAKARGGAYTSGRASSGGGCAFLFLGLVGGVLAILGAAVYGVAQVLT